MSKVLSITKGSGTGGGAPTGASYVTLGLDGTLTAERVLTGTANQVILTDGGANGNITLSLPQSIDTAAAVQFGTLQLPAGSASAPTLFFTGALTSGLFSTGANQLGIAVNGTLALQMNSAQLFGWHGTAPSSSNVNTTVFTNTTTLTPSVFNSTTFTYGYTGIGASSGVVVLSFEAINQRSGTPVVAASLLATQKTSTVGDAIAISINPRLDIGTTMSTGTLNLVGTDFTPSPAGTGKVTGGTVNIYGLRVTALPANYAGGGATVNFYSVSSSGAAILYNQGNVGIGTNSQFGSGIGVLGMANAATLPTTNPTSGGTLYADAGALKWRGSSGTVTTVAVA